MFHCCDNIVSANQIRETALHCLISNSKFYDYTSSRRGAQSNVRNQLPLFKQEIDLLLFVNIMGTNRFHPDKLHERFFALVNREFNLLASLVLL